MYEKGLHPGQNGNGTFQVCPPKKNVQVRCSMGEPHSGQRAFAIRELAEMRKSITSADTDFSIGGIGRLSALIRVPGHLPLNPRLRVSRPMTLRTSDSPCRIQHIKGG
jgi:hypothetical protein